MTIRPSRSPRGSRRFRRTHSPFTPRKQHPWRNWSIAAALLLPLFLAFLWIQLRNEQRLYWLRLVLRGPEAPSEITAREYLTDNIPLTNTLAATGVNLGTATEASSGLLDVPATVRATVKAGGFLTPVDQNAKGQADYIVLIEKKGPNDHLARLVDQILDRIDAAGLTIRRYYYRHEPIRAEPASSDRSALPLRDVVAGGQRHRFLVVGGSEGFFHPITGELQRWTEAFETLASRTLLSARPMQNWTYEQDELQKVGFAIGEASPAGMASYCEAVAAGRESSAITIAPADLAPSQIDEKKIAREKRGWRELLSDFRPIGLAALATPLAATLGLGLVMLGALSGLERVWFEKPPPEQVELAAAEAIDPDAPASPFGIAPERWLDGVPGGDLSSFREFEGAPEMAVIPAGRFEMGATEPSAFDDERPVREVSVSRFALARTEVTFDQWRACVDDGGCANNASPEDEGWGRASRPVINVSWEDAQDYVMWLNSKVEGAPYRLPTEAEWEYAARGLATAETPNTLFGWGDEDPVCEQGPDNGAVFAECGVIGPRAVGFSAPNAFGLYDMHGKCLGMGRRLLCKHLY